MENPPRRGEPARSDPAGSSPVQTALPAQQRVHKPLPLFGQTEQSRGTMPCVRSAGVVPLPAPILASTRRINRST